MGFHFAENGVSFDECSEVYCGPEAFSEIETANIRDFFKSLEPVPALGWCFHSYSQLWLWPYGYAYDAYPPNYKEVQQLAIDASDALYPAAGASDDWYMSEGSRFVFTTELRDTGRYGF